MKAITLKNLMNFREINEKFDKKYHEQMNKLNIILINHYNGLSDLHPVKDSEAFASLDFGLTKAYEGVTEIMKDDQQLKYDVIVEGQPIKEILLYALAYRMTKKISEFSLNLFLKKYHETREKLWKVKDCVMTVYLMDDADDHTYHTIMFSNFINNDNDLII